MSASVSTVNVIEIPDTGTMGGIMVTSYLDPDGVREAEQHFIDCIKEQKDISAEDIEDALENGYYECGIYYIALVHS